MGTALNSSASVVVTLGACLGASCGKKLEVEEGGFEGSIEEWAFDVVSLLEATRELTSECWLFVRECAEGSKSFSSSEGSKSDF